MKHVIAVSAYGESPFLEQCLSSLKQQKHGGDVVICTSTPGDFINKLAWKYNIPVYERDGEPGLADDWNFCIAVARDLDADFVTIAHQDDRYLPDYSWKVTRVFEFGQIPFVCTRCENKDEHGHAFTGKAEKVKRFLRWPLSIWALTGTGFGKLHALRFGNAIACPTVTYNLGLLEGDLFDSGYRFVTDWEALRKIALMPGQIICVEEPLVEIRLHDDSETKSRTDDGTREKEEAEMLEKMNPKWLAGLIKKFYRPSEVYGK